MGVGVDETRNQEPARPFDDAVASLRRLVVDGADGDDGAVLDEDIAGIKDAVLGVEGHHEGVADDQTGWLVLHASPRLTR